MTNRINSKEVQLKYYSITRLRVLIELANRGSMCKHELAEIFKNTPDSISEILARLAKDGAVRRIPVLKDGRKIYNASITLTGREELNKAFSYATGKEFNNANHGRDG